MPRSAVSGKPRGGYVDRPYKTIDAAQHEIFMLLRDMPTNSPWRRRLHIEHNAKGFWIVAYGESCSR